MIDPFAPTYPPLPDDTAETRVQHALSLFELNSMVRAMLQHTMGDCYWVAAEVSEIRTASNGHCYLEFVQKDANSGSLVAKARANIWRSDYVRISSSFERATGQRLTSGIKVMAFVSVKFHELYGFSLNVLDIDPTYTLGDLAQRRQQIIKQLEEDGVLELNKELPLPRVIRNVAVISSPTAAGYGDFCNQMEQSGFQFHIQLFAATMQGDHVEQSVIAALDDIAHHAEQWDVVVIIRGGGATTDLNGFDSYLLAANVAQFPLPVLTGIGHERDDTIVDLVAHTRLKTPTAVAAFLIDTRGNETLMLQALQERLIKAVEARLQLELSRLDVLTQRRTYSISRQVDMQRQHFNALSHRFEMASSRYVSKQREKVLRLASRMDVLTQMHIQRQQAQLQHYPQRLQQAVERWFMQANHRHEILERSLHLAGPDRILAMGFSITTANGKAVRNANELKAGDELVTRFSKGSVHSIVK